MSERAGARATAGTGPQHGRARRGALLLLAAGLLSGCGLLGPTPPEETATEPSQSEEEPTGIGGQGEDDEAYGAACTGEGDFSVDSSARRPLDGVSSPEGAQLVVSLGYTAPDGPRARLALSTDGGSASPEEFDGEVGASSRYDAWTITLRSICDGEVGFEVDEA